MGDRVSIIMPVRNTAKYLNATLDSILAQSYENWELICIDNLSEDESFQILKDYAKKDDRIKVYQNTNSDLISALQLAYSKSSGAYITRMDSDDLMTPNRLQLMVEVLAKETIPTVVSGLVNYFSDEGELGGGFLRYEKWLNNLSEHEANFSEVYKECVIPSPCWMVTRNVFEQSGAFNSEIYPEDYDLCFRFYEQGLRVKTVKETMVHWRDYSTRNSRTDPNYADQLFFDLKLKYFFKLDHNSAQRLIVWGAGRKGKLLVKKIQQFRPEINLVWVTDNEKKVGKDIYDLKLMLPETISDKDQVIVAVSNEEEQEQIREVLLKKKSPTYFFC